MSSLPVDPVLGTPWEWTPIDQRAPVDLVPFVFRVIPIPECSGEDDANLGAHIRAHGVRTPLLVLHDNRVIDGRARLRHALALGLPSVPVQVLLTPVDDLEIEIHAALGVLGVRNLSPGRCFELLLARDEMTEERTQRRRGRPRSVSRAEKTGLSRRTAFRALAIKRFGSVELWEQVTKGELAIDAAFQLLPPQPQRGEGPRMPPEAFEALAAGIGPRLWELSIGFPTWPRADQERFIEALGEFRGTIADALTDVSGHAS